MFKHDRIILINFNSFKRNNFLSIILSMFNLFRVAKSFCLWHFWPPPVEYDSIQAFYYPIFSAVFRGFPTSVIYRSELIPPYKSCIVGIWLCPIVCIVPLPVLFNIVVVHMNKYRKFECSKTVKCCLPSATLIQIVLN